MQVDLRTREWVERDNLHRLFMQAPFLVGVLRGPTHVVELANPPILRAWGKTAAILGRPLAVALPELEGQPFLGYLDEVFRTGVAYEGRGERARLPVGPNGEPEDAYYNYVYAPLRDANGAIEGVLISGFDVTEQMQARFERARLLEDEQRARAEAEAAHARVRSLFMQAPIPLCMLEGPEHRYTLANVPFTTLVGHPDLVGHTVAELFPARVEQGVLHLLDQVYATGQAYHGSEIMLRLARRVPGQIEDGLFNLVYEPFRDLEGNISGIVAVVVDVTDQVLARQASEQARRDAEAAAEAQRELARFQERFVAVLGHDLRNPIAAIDMAAGLLGQQSAKSPDPITQRVVTRIRSSARRMSRMVEQILDLSRSRLAGGIAVAPVAMDLGAMLAAVVEELRVASPDREIQLRCPPLPGAWDRDRLEQVFSNLISNAIHHGGADTPVVVEARRDERGIRVDVHNEGPPIPTSVRDALFSAFRRGSRDSRGPKTAGLGLGLFISREIVVAHGGEIAVESNPHDGTTFRVTLPSTMTALASSQVEST